MRNATFSLLGSQHMHVIELLCKRLKAGQKVFPAIAIVRICSRLDKSIALNSLLEKLHMTMDGLGCCSS